MKKIVIAIVSFLIINIITAQNIANASCLRDSFLDDGLVDMEKYSAVFTGTVIDNTNNKIKFKIKKVIKGDISDVVFVDALAESEEVLETYPPINKKDTTDIMPSSSLEYVRGSNYYCGCKRDFFKKDREYKVFGHIDENEINQKRNIAVYPCDIRDLQQKKNRLFISLFILLIIITSFIIYAVKKRGNKKTYLVRISLIIIYICSASFYVFFNDLFHLILPLSFLLLIFIFVIMILITIYKKIKSKKIPLAQ